MVVREELVLTCDGCAAEAVEDKNWNENEGRRSYELGTWLELLRVGALGKRVYYSAGVEFEFWPPTSCIKADAAIGGVFFCRD